MNKLKVFIAALTAFVVLMLLSPFAMKVLPGFAGPVYAGEDWKTEFETVCAGAQDPAQLLDDELKKFVDRCDNLKPLIEKLEETQKKIYLKRLQMCRSLFVFILESREKK